MTTFLIKKCHVCDQSIDLINFHYEVGMGVRNFVCKECWECNAGFLKFIWDETSPLCTMGYCNQPRSEDCMLLECTEQYGPYKRTYFCEKCWMDNIGIPVGNWEEAIP
jgi:hypothetical protein